MLKLENLINGINEIYYEYKIDPLVDVNDILNTKGKIDRNNIISKSNSSSSSNTNSNSNIYNVGKSNYSSYNNTPKTPKSTTSRIMNRNNESIIYK